MSETFVMKERKVGVWNEVCSKIDHQIYLSSKFMHIYEMDESD